MTELLILTTMKYALYGLAIAMWVCRKNKRNRAVLGFGGGDDIINQAPAAPAAPSTADAINAYIAGLPQMYNAQLQYAPQFAQQQLDLISQLAPQYKALQESLYPETSKIQEQLAGIASKGYTEGLTGNPELKNQYLDYYKSLVGDNAASGIGADYVSGNLIKADEGYRQNYYNLGLAVSGRQPLYNAAGTPTPDLTQGYNFGSVQGGLQQGYGNYSSLYGNMYNSNLNYASSNYASQLGLYGAGLGAIGSIGGGFAMHSSIDFKEDIQENDIDSTELLRGIDIVNFRYKKEMDFDRKKHVGFIVEELPEELVSEKDKRQVDVINLLGVLTDAVKKIDARLEKLEAK